MIGTSVSKSRAGPTPRKTKGTALQAETREARYKFLPSNPDGADDPRPGPDLHDIRRSS